MSDVKLFEMSGERVSELRAESVAVEKSLQTLIERHLVEFLNVRLIASEHSTGKTHGGRIDTLGLDENNCPVIIEYKRALNQNVINQGLFYLDWLMDHRAEFALLAMRRFEATVADEIEWSSPRLLCIAGDFTKYDEHAVQQINRNIELIRYRRYGDRFLLFELVNATTATPPNDTANGEAKTEPKGQYKGFAELLALADPDLQDRYEALKAFLLALGDDVQTKQLKYYVAFRRLNNFACVEVHPRDGHILVYVKLDPSAISLEKEFTRDVHSIGHYGTGGLEIRITSSDDLEKAKPMLLKSYEAS